MTGSLSENTAKPCQAHLTRPDHENFGLVCGDISLILFIGSKLHFQDSKPPSCAMIARRMPAPLVRLGLVTLVVALFAVRGGHSAPLPAAPFDLRLSNLPSVIRAQFDKLPSAAAAKVSGG